LIGSNVTTSICQFPLIIDLSFRYVGQVHFQPGTWVGIQYDEPTGKNDGSVGGTRYFTCQDKYGGFVRPATVEVGDFPEEDLDFSDGEM